MRTVGRYKDNEIIITSLYQCETYARYPLGDIKIINPKIVNFDIYNESKRLFGYRSSCLAGRNKVNLEKHLPAESVWAYLQCKSPVKKGDGSELVLIWFQDYDQDPFAMVAEKLKTIKWEDYAEDFVL